jgi:hypothetical protein
MSAIARRSTQYGYFQVDALHVEVSCPQCRERVRVAHLAWATKSERVKALRSMVLDHLQMECGL